MRLYNSDDLKGAKDVIITEGAVDCLTLMEQGFCSVGLPGVKTFVEDWLMYFVGVKNVYVCFDNDEGGKKAVKGLSTFFDVLRVIELPETKEKLDVNKFFKQGGTKEQFETMMGDAKELFGAKKYDLGGNSD